MGCVDDGTYICEQLHTMPLHTMNTPRLMQFLHRDRLRSVEPSLVYPRLDAVEVDGRHFDFEPTHQPIHQPIAFKATALANVLYLLHPRITHQMPLTD